MSTPRGILGRLSALPWVLAFALALCTSAGSASAAPRSFGFEGGAVPVIDGNGDDLINFASGVGTTSCAVNFDDLRDDVAIADPKIVVCAPQQDTSVPPDGINDYFVNGFDLRKFVLVYDRPNKNLYVLWRTEGFIGDVDGNQIPDNANCVPAASFADEPGIGSQENYQARIDTNCDGIPDVIVSVGGVIGVDPITVQGASIGGSQLAYRAGAGSGRDLELKISNIDLPPAFTVIANTNASFDGLGEDITAKVACGVPNPSIDVEKSVNVPTICPGGTADFTVVVTNTGNVDLTNVSVVDNLPAGLVYQSTQSNTCGGAVSANGSQITYGPFSLATGASCTIVIRVGRTAECAGEKINNVAVEGTFQSPCFNAGQPVTVSDKDAISVLCGNVICSIDAPDTHVCPGETVQICGPEGGYSYLWNTGATTRCITVGAGTYSLVVTEIASGCVSNNQCSVTIIEDPRPTCSISAPDTHVCPGETVQICGPEGNYSYLWNTGATTRCITVGAGTYSLVITDLVSGCVSNNACAVTIIEDPRPTCSISAPDTHVCPGETVEICGPEGNYSYLWNTGATTRCITVGAGSYSLVITDLATGCVSNNACAVTIIEDPRPTCSISAPDTHVCPGETVEICGPEGNYSYLWNTGAVTRCITVGAGSYSLVITDLATGCVSNNACAVTIIEDPRPTCEISAPDTHVCPGETVQICGPEGNFSYLWNTGATTRCINVGAGTYSLVITDLVSGCVSNNACAVTIIEDPRPTCSISAPDTHVCPGETVEICGPEGNFSYLWNTGATTRCISVGAGNYSLVITDLATGCVSNNACAVTIIEDPRPTCSISAPDTDVCPGETVEICGPNGNYSYLWNTGATTRCITVGVGTYSLVITDLATGCVSNNSCSVTIIEAPRPTCSISAPDTHVCPGETVEICGPEGDYTYLWNTGATTRCITVGAGTYSLVITSAGGCVSDNSCTVTIIEDPRPTCEISAPDTQICPGETVEICGPVGNYSYAWSNGATTRCITVGAGTYSLVITDLATGCVSNNACAVTIVEDPRPTCEISAPDTQVCPGETVEICGPNGNFSYAWNTGATTRCITVGAGTYTLTITNLSSGCVSENSCSVTIIENPRPVCEISAPDTHVCAGESVEICGPAGPYSYLWNTGATTRCITVGAGTYSLVITNTETGCVSNNACAVTIVEDPRPTCEITALDRSVCAGQTVEVCGPEGNYSYLWSNGATTRCINVGAGTYSLVVTDLTTGCHSNNACAVTITEDVPRIEVEKSVSPEGPVEQGTILTYTIVVRNPSQTGVAVDNIVVTDVLCDETLYAGNASPAPTSEPAVGANGTVVWNVAGSLPAGESLTFTFQARVRELPSPDCGNEDRSCTNHVSVEARCGEGRASDDADVTTPILPCEQPGLCRLTGGGCLNEKGDNKGHKQSTFGGNSSPAHEGGGPTGNSWEHVYRDGKTILFNWHSWDAHVVQCSVVEPGPCSPHAVNTRADFVGTGKYSIGAGGREEAGNMVAYIVDHKEGSCNRDSRDEYFITVRTGSVIGEGEVVFQTGGEIDCGNLQIHETPARLFGSAIDAPVVGSSIESVQLLNRAVPNPFTSSMNYAFEVIGSDSPVDVGVYNVAGRLVKTLVQSTLPAGRHTATWNGTDEGGAKVPSGVYFVRARYGTELQQQRVIYLGR